jgi:pimeloyl-ACP methyl ester carboxylesterase
VLGAPADALVLENPYDRLVTTVGHRFEAMGLPAQPGAALLVFWGGIELGFNGFGVNPIDFARSIHTPTLLLVGDEDPRVHVAEVESIRASLAGPADIVVFPGAGHVGLYSADPTLWRSAVTGFLDREAPMGVPDSNPGARRSY